MVDISRTLAAIKSLLASNNSGNVSAQNLRDMVESIVNPVIGGGFDAPIISQTTMIAFRQKNPAGLIDGIYDVYTKAAVTDIASQDVRLINWNGTVNDGAKSLYDPAGYLNAAPVADPGWYGVNPYPTGTLVTVSPGMYMWSAVVQVDVDPAPSNVTIFLDVIRDPATAGTDFMKKSPGLGFGLAQDGQANVYGSSSGALVCDETTSFGIFVFAVQGLPAPKAMKYVNFCLTRIR